MLKILVILIYGIFLGVFNIWSNIVYIKIKGLLLFWFCDF